MLTGKILIRLRDVQSDLNIFTGRTYGKVRILIVRFISSFNFHQENRNPFLLLCLYNFGPLKPHFYMVKLGFTGVYIIFLISAKNIDCGYSIEPPRRGGSTSIHSICLEQKNETYLNFYLNIFIFGGKIFSIFE